MISKETAIDIARKYLRNQDYAINYKMDSPLAYIVEDEYHIEFQDIREDIEPGCCIIAVDMNSGIPRLEPVE